MCRWAQIDNCMVPYIMMHYIPRYLGLSHTASPARRSQTHAESGFTLLELVTTIVVAGALIGLVFLVAHPKDYAPQQHNGSRWTDVAQIMQAMRAYYADNGSLPAGLTDKATPIGNAKDMLNLCPAFVPKYMRDVPLDPVDGGQYAVDDCRGTSAEPGKYVTGYTVMLAKDGTLTVDAPSAEKGQAVRMSQKF